MFQLPARALAHLLDALYAAVPSFGASIALTTAVLVALLLPLTFWGARAQHFAAARMRALRPKLDAIKAEHAEDPVARQTALAACMAEHDIGVTAQLRGCLPLVVQSPVFFGMFQLLRGLTRETAGTSDPRFVAVAGPLRDAIVSDGGRMVTLGLDLAATPAAEIAAGLTSAVPALGIVCSIGVVAAATVRLGQRQTGATSRLPYVFAAVSPAIALTLPAGIAVFSLVAALSRLGQQALVVRSLGA